jgi:uncharacterized membrane protein
MVQGMRSGRRFLPRSRVMTAAFLLFNGAMLWWFVEERRHLTACSARHCPSPVRLAFIVTSWAFGALFVSMLWLAVERRLGLRDLIRFKPRTSERD